MTDRHRAKRNYKSGFEKLKEKQEKQRKNDELLSKTHRMTDFIKLHQTVDDRSQENNDVNKDESIHSDNLQSETSEMQHALLKDINDQNEISDLKVNELIVVNDDVIHREPVNPNNLLHPNNSEVQHAFSEDVHTLENKKAVEKIRVNMTNEDLRSLGSQLQDKQNVVKHGKIMLINDDISQWPFPMDDKTVDYWISVAGSSNIQNCDPKLLDSKSCLQEEKSFSRKCNINMFERTIKNGDVVKRPWVCFSPITGKLYCFHCKLFATNCTLKTQLTYYGFADWKNAHTRLLEHEKSRVHLDAIQSFTMRSSLLGIINVDIKRQTENEKAYWIKVLQRVIKVIIFLAERNLPFRGDNEILGNHNNGNFLGIIELMSEYDDFLKLHIVKYGEKGSGRVSYLSSTTYEELIEIIGNKLLDNIIARVRKSKYYALSVDSTTDIGHVDQLSLCIRYIDGNEPVERFVIFMDNEGHSAQNMFDAVMSFLNKHLIDIKCCYGTSFDNASVMSGKYNGLRTLVQHSSQSAVWVPCMGHSLNLVGTASMACCLEVQKFFDFLERMYVFFTGSGSTDRHNLLSRKLQENVHNKKDRVLLPKKVSTTRWGSRQVAVKSVKKGFKAYESALTELSNDNSEAQGLLDILKRLETSINLAYWSEILEQMNKVSVNLQNSHADLNTSISLQKSLKEFIESFRNNFNKYEQIGVQMSGCNEYERSQKRVRRPNVRRNPLDYGQAEAAVFSDRDNFRVKSFIPVIDTLVCSLNEKITAYADIDNCFGFLRKLCELSCEEIQVCATRALEKYPDDLDDGLPTELVHFKYFVREFTFPQKKKGGNTKNDCIELKMYKLITEKDLENVFPNVMTFLKIYLVIMTTNCTCERSFSKLKLTKTRLRSSMGQDRLNNLTRMSAEYDVLKEINYSVIIDDFATKKVRSVPL